MDDPDSFVAVTPKGRRVLVKTWHSDQHEGITFVELPDRVGSITFGPGEPASEVRSRMDLHLRHFDQVIDDLGP